MNDFLVYPRHVRMAGLCLVPGAKEWGQLHGFEWKSFIRNGIPALQLIATGDAFALRVVECARKEYENGQP